MIKKRIVSAFLAITMIFGVGFASSSGAYAEGEGDPIEISTADNLYAAFYYGGSYKLTADINTADSQYGGYLYALTDEVRIDLGGHTITLPDSASVYAWGADIVIDGDGGKIVQNGNDDYATVWAYQGNVVLNGGSIEGGKYAVRVSDGKKFTMNGGSVSSGEFGIVANGASEVIINDGEVNAPAYALSGNGLETGAKFYIKGGNLISDDYAIYMPQIDGALEVSGGQISGAAGAIAMNRGSATISGGSLTSLGTASISGDVSQDGTYGYSNAVIGIAKEYGSVTVNISGGEFIAQGNAEMIVDPSGLDTEYEENVIISGGKYSKLPKAEYVADGFDIYDVSPDGPYFVEAATTVDLPEKLFLQVGETYTPTLSSIATKYGTFGSSSAIATVGEGNVVTANAVGSGLLNFNLHNYIDPFEANIDLTVFEVGQRTNDDADDETDSANLATFWGDEVKAALASGRTSGWYRSEKSEIDMSSLLDAISRGVKLESGFVLNNVSKEDAPEHSSGYEQLMAALGDNEEMVAFFNATISLSSDELLHSVGFASAINNPVTMRLAIPENYRDKEGTLSVLRSHYDRASDSYVVDKMYSTRDGDDLLVENSLFSTFAIVYTPSTNATTPETGVITRTGGSATVASLITAIFVGITTSVLSFGYLINRRNR